MNVVSRLKKFLALEIDGQDPITKQAGKFTVAEMMDLQVIAAALKGDIKAWEKINDRIEGKAVARHDVVVDTPEQALSKLWKEQDAEE